MTFNSIQSNTSNDYSYKKKTNNISILEIEIYLIEKKYKNYIFEIILKLIYIVVYFFFLLLSDIEFILECFSFKDKNIFFYSKNFYFYF
jgi:hypothetical protein